MTDHYRSYAGPGEQAAIIILILIQVVLVSWYVYQQRMEARHWPDKVFKVGYIVSERVESKISPYGPGLEKELVVEFCRRNNLTPVWVELNCCSQGIEGLENNEIHLFLPSPGIQVPDSRQLARGPEYLEGGFLILHNRWRHPLDSLEDLCLTDVVVPDGRVFEDILEYLRVELECVIKPDKRTAPGIEFFEAMTDRKFRFGIKDEINYKFFKGLFPEVRNSGSFDKDYALNWIWNRYYINLDKKLKQFWMDIQHSGLLEELLDKYLGFYPESQDPYALRHFEQALKKELPKYIDTILEASRRYDLDPLLLVALIYQESHFDPVATSRTGVRGLLQITSQTAEFLGIEDRLDPHESIMGGARYLQMLGERMDRIDITSWDKWFMVLAAYNQGLGHVYDARTLAERKGYNPDSWTWLKKSYPLLSYEKYYKTLPRGYARGQEAVNFVDNVRYYYYLLYGKILLSRFESEDLGRFLDFIPSNWPE
ncbi:transglycosylase SLT domain-containing protein [Desulfonatronospira sp.]|uniref:transglycosylase SLT domain-containing protein n=1 Tax=Desulfonatronospira sp. TaxID=1962951 RepID=UPI0025C11B45|nr:transglycosylase SLT domain-containing protein [Desulfonatronospira sp.]